MTQKSKQDQIHNLAAWAMLILLVIGILAMVFLATSGHQAKKYCQRKGHDTGQYKADDGGYYSCQDFTEYHIQDIKDGEN